MRASYLVPLACAAVIAGSTVASAQGFRDDPPGWAFQKRGIIEMNGGDPLHYPHYGYSRGYGSYAWAPHWRYRHHYRHRHWR